MTVSVGGWVRRTVDSRGLSVPFRKLRGMSESRSRHSKVWWSPSCFAASVGYVSTSTVSGYIVANGRRPASMLASADSLPPATRSYIDNPRWGAPQPPGWPQPSSGYSGRACDQIATASGRLVQRQGVARSPTSARPPPQASTRSRLGRYDLLVVEDLEIANMLRRAKPVPVKQTRPVSGQQCAGQVWALAKRKRRGLGPVHFDSASQSGRGWAHLDRGRPPAYVRPLRKLWACRTAEPHHPSVIRLPAMFASLPGRRTRRAEHPEGWTGPSRPSSVKRSQRR